MAGNVQIAIKDEQAAKQWRDMVADINTDYQKAMTDAAETLMNMKDFADGTLVDEFCNYGTRLMNAAQVTFQAVSDIATTVITIVDKVNDFKSKAISGIVKLADTILNY